MIRFLARTGAALVLGAPVVLAQPTEPPIPAELVRALMSGPFGANQATFIVGKLPPTWPADLTPAPGAATVGVVNQPWQRVAVYAVTETPELVIPDFAAGLRRAGWTSPAPRPQPGGFNATGLQGAPPTQFCRGDSLATVTGAPRLTGGYVYVALQTGGSAFACRTPMATGRDVIGSDTRVAFVEARPVGSAQVPIPILRAPDGVTPIGSTSSGGLDRWEGESRVRSGLRPAELLDLYGLQLAKDGWTMGERVAGTAVAMQVAERRDTTGTTWRATLTAAAYGDSLQREVALRIVNKARR